MGKRQEPDSPYKLYVEGNDDLYIICNLAVVREVACKLDGQDNVTPNFHVMQYDETEKELFGIDSLKQKLPVLLKNQRYERLGIVVDADDKLLALWLSLRQILVVAGYSDVPTAPDPAGTIIIDPELPTIGIWIWPDNENAGMLEDFVGHLIQPDDLLLPKARQTVSEVVEIDRRFPEHYEQKAIIHTWLAWQKKPGRPQGQGVLAKYFDKDCEAATRFLGWLGRLFE